MILITGAPGYVGNHLTSGLAQDGKQVRAMISNRRKAEKEGV